MKRSEKKLLTWVQDTREQRELTLAPPDPRYFIDGGSYVDGLPEGDYTAELDTVRLPIVIERKGIADFFMCVGRERERFTAELGRLREYEAAHVLIEATWEQVVCGYERSQVSGDAAVKSAIHWQTMYGIGFHFIGRRGAARWVRWTLEEFARHKALRA